MVNPQRALFGDAVGLLNPQMSKTKDSFKSKIFSRKQKNCLRGKSIFISNCCLKMALFLSFSLPPLFTDTVLKMPLFTFLFYELFVWRKLNDDILSDPSTDDNDDHKISDSLPAVSFFLRDDVKYLIVLFFLKGRSCHRLYHRPLPDPDGVGRLHLLPLGHSKLGSA